MPDKAPENIVVRINAKRMGFVRDDACGTVFEEIGLLPCPITVAEKDKCDEA